jgi:glycosyltransferase involved in cell wall biosynthesis
LSKLTNLNLVAPINTVSYGIVSLNILKELSNLLDVSLWPIGQPQVTNQNDWDYVQRACENARSYDPDAPCIRIWHQFDLAQFVGRGKHIGFSIFELDQFNKTEKHHLKSVDHIFVPSDWAKEIVRNDLGEPYALRTNVIPLGVDTSLFKPTKLVAKENFVFFNCGKWEVRKGHDFLATAFNKAFSPEDKVELWLMTENPFCSEEEDAKWKSMYKNTAMYAAGKIKFIPRVNTHEQVYKIMSQADCGIFPSRAEGWNLEALEMMAIGRPVVITNYSAHTQYCNDKNSFLIPVNQTELAHDDKWFFGQGSWGEIKIKDIIEMMQFARNSNRSYFQDCINTANKFTWKNTAKEIINVLELL